MTLVDLLALALAAKAMLDAWFDEDSILADRRAVTQTWTRWFWRTLFNCRFCLSYWVPAFLLAVLYVASLFLSDPWVVVVKLPIYSLAATALVGLIDILVREPTPAPPSTDNVADRSTDDTTAT